MEESKVPENYVSQLTINELMQSEYMFTKILPSNNIVNIGSNILLLKNNNKFVSIKLCQDDNLFEIVYIINGRIIKKEKCYYYYEVIDEVSNYILNKNEL